ncbi:MAG: hypothetical protein IT361_11325 [Gemmatimonadaceae bacterium]|nr:hypothetical protein [Gemmatimonadaceae bacterium]
MIRRIREAHTPKRSRSLKRVSDWAAAALAMRSVHFGIIKAERAERAKGGAKGVDK